MQCRLGSEEAVCLHANCDEVSYEDYYVLPERPNGLKRNARLIRICVATVVAEVLTEGERQLIKKKLVSTSRVVNFLLKLLSVLFIIVLMTTVFLYAWLMPTLIRNCNY